MKVLGIFRAACYSPGMVERDEAILRAVMARLATAGHIISLIHEEELTPDTPMPDIALHMARSFQALQVLENWQSAGCRVINSVESVRGVERATLARWCAMRGISTPKTWIVSTAIPDIRVWETTEGECETITFPCWVKRTGECAQQADDVCRVNDSFEYRACLHRFQKRGIAEVVVMEHLEGPVVKFYGVRGTDFFYWLPADKLGYDKFAQLSDKSNTITYNEEQVNSLLMSLKAQLSPKSASGYPIMSSALTVYGGDAIIAADGTVRLIDLNDWPSFSACRELAADAIAQLVL